MKFKNAAWILPFIVGLAACGAQEPTENETADTGVDSSVVEQEDAGVSDVPIDVPVTEFVESPCTLVRDDFNRDNATDLKILYYGSRLQPRRTVTTSGGNTTTVDQDYDEAGRLIFLRYDRDSDGVVDVTLSYTYDESGDLQQFGANTDADPDFEYISVSEKTPSGYPLTNMADGVFNFETVELVEAADGRPNYLHNWEYNDQDQFVHFTIKFGGTEVIQYEETRTYTPAGKLLMIERDGVANDSLGIYQVADGVVNHRRAYGYDGSGNEILEEIDGFHVFLPASYYTEDADGVADFISKDKKFDANGNLLSFLLAGRFAIDGQYSLKTPGFFDRYDQEWAKIGDAWLKTKFSLDERNKNSLDLVVVTQYDEGGRVTKIQQDGLTDARGRIVTRANGEWNDVTDQTFTAAGNFLSWQRDMDGDGQADVDTRWTWIDTPMGERRTLYEQDGSLPRTFAGYEYGVSGQADGIIDIRFENEYDEHGRETSAMSKEPGRSTYSRIVDYGECGDLEAL